MKVLCETMISSSTKTNLSSSQVSNFNGGIVKVVSCADFDHSSNESRSSNPSTVDRMVSVAANEGSQSATSIAADSHKDRQQVKSRRLFYRSILFSSHKRFILVPNEWGKNPSFLMFLNKFRRLQYPALSFVFHLQSIKTVVAPFFPIGA